jgi:hypothetical protein
MSDARQAKFRPPSSQLAKRLFFRLRATGRMSLNGIRTERYDHLLKSAPARPDGSVHSA